MTRWLLSIFVQLPARVVLAGLFGYAAVLKLQNPQEFAFAIKGYELLDPAREPHLIATLAFAIPWAELVCAALLLAGYWTRAAGWVLSLQIAAFTVAIANALRLEKEMSCSCFGDAEFICEGAIGWCHLARNGVLLGASVLLGLIGGGKLALDAITDRDPTAGGPVDGEADSA